MKFFCPVRLEGKDGLFNAAIGITPCLLRFLRDCFGRVRGLLGWIRPIGSFPFWRGFGLVRKSFIMAAGKVRGYTPARRIPRGFL